MPSNHPRTFIALRTSGKYQLTFRGNYIGTFNTREEAEEEKKRLQEVTPKKSGGARKGAGRPKKSDQ